MKANLFIALGLEFFALAAIAFAWLYGPELLIPIAILAIVSVAMHAAWGEKGWNPFRDH